jgi:hypothetical protein
MLREALDEQGGTDVRVYFPLVMGLRTMSSETAKQGVISTLQTAMPSGAFDALWLRAVGFEFNSSGPVNFRNYITTARALHSLQVPVVGDRTGTVGMGLMALGAIGGITSDITLGERYDPRPLFRQQREGRGFLPHHRVYVPSIGAFLDRKRAETFYKHSSIRNWMACQSDCCPQGILDMLANPRRHFVSTRVKEVGALAHVPEDLRAPQYLESWLRPATDRATMASRVDDKFLAHRARLDDWRVTVAAQIEEDKASPSKATRSPSRLRVRKRA